MKKFTLLVPAFTRMTASPFRYCPRCAHALVWRKPSKQDPRRLTCPHCGFIFFNNPVTANEAYIVRGGKILMLRRAHAPRQGFWDFPGGFYEGTEDPFTGIRREVKEELGVAFKPNFLLGAYHDLYYYQDRVIRVMILGYVGTISGKIKLSNENTEFSWEPFPITKPLAFHHHRPAVRDLKKYLQKS